MVIEVRPETEIGQSLEMPPVYPQLAQDLDELYELFEGGHWAQGRLMREDRYCLIGGIGMITGGSVIHYDKSERGLEAIDALFKTLYPHNSGYRPSDRVSLLVAHNDNSLNVSHILSLIRSTRDRILKKQD